MRSTGILNIDHDGGRSFPKMALDNNSIATSGFLKCHLKILANTIPTSSINIGYGSINYDYNEISSEPLLYH